jgi:hypothetical protein
MCVNLRYNEYEIMGSECKYQGFRMWTESATEYHCVLLNYRQLEKKLCFRIINLDILKNPLGENIAEQIRKKFLCQ